MQDKLMNHLLIIFLVESSVSNVFSTISFLHYLLLVRSINQIVLKSLNDQVLLIRISPL